MTIHASAMVGPSVHVPASVAVGPYCIIEDGVTLEEGVVLGPHCVVHRGTRVGAYTRLAAHVVLGGAPQDARHDPSVQTALVIGRGNHFREFSTAHRGTSTGRAATVIGDDNWFMATSHVAHDCIVGSGCTLANGVALAGHVEVGDGATFGGLSAVHQFARIGRLAMVSGGAMCTQDVPPFTIAQGDRARLRGLNTVGLRRSGVGAEARMALKNAYRLLFLQGLPRQEAIGRVQRELGEVTEVEELLDFIRGSERGLCRAVLP